MGKKTCRNCGEPIHKEIMAGLGVVWLHDRDYAARCKTTYADPGDQWVMIADFPDYEITRQGYIRRVINEFPISVYQSHKTWTVRLRRKYDEKSYYKSVNKLLAIAFPGEGVKVKR